MPDEIDKTLMTEIKTHADDLYYDHAERDADFQKYEKAYLMGWADDQPASIKNKMRVTQSPDAHNQVKGAVRLMCATEPQFNVSDLGAEVPDQEKIEKYIGKVWALSGRRKGEPVHNALTLSAILYDEVHAGITPMREMVDYLDKKKPEDERQLKYWTAQREQWEEAAGNEQFLIEPWSPMGGYPEFSRLGLTAYHRREDMTVASLRDRFGDIPAYRDRKRTEKVTLKYYVDEVYSAYWTNEGDLFLDEHGYGFVPVVAQLIDGSNIFAATADKRQPMLYALIKSGLWDAQNLALTVMYTAALAMGSVTKFVYVPSVEGNTIDFNWDQEIATVHPGDQFGAIDLRNVIPQPLQEAYQLAVQKGNESTIYPAALGAPAEKNTTYSEFALMSQAGRLPLVGPQHRGGWAISKIMELLFRIARNTPAYLQGSGLTSADIPAGMMIDTKLEVKLPQERLQMANVGKMLNDLGVPNEFILQNILGINNPKEQRRLRWNEMTSEIMYQQTVQQLMQQAQAQAQQAQQQPQQPPMQGQPPMQRQGPPPSAGPMMSPDQGIEGGLPQAQGGMMPGMGQAEVPPEMEGME